MALLHCSAALNGVRYSRRCRPLRRFIFKKWSYLGPVGRRKYWRGSLFATSIPRLTNTALLLYPLPSDHEALGSFLLLCLTSFSHLREIFQCFVFNFGNETAAANIRQLGPFLARMYTSWNLSSSDLGKILYISIGVGWWLAGSSPSCWYHVSVSDISDGKFANLMIRSTRQHEEPKFLVYSLRSHQFLNSIGIHATHDSVSFLANGRSFIIVLSSLTIFLSDTECFY